MFATLRRKKRLLTALLLLLLLLSLVLRPQLAYQSALKGLSLWWQVVAPALLPFFIISELLLELGIAAYLEPLLSRIMEPLFALPGSGALAVAMGFCSGFPSGAAITAGLRREESITAEQGARLIAFSNNAGPLYITVSVATGLLGCPGAGLALAAAHYGADLLLGLGLGIWARLRGEKITPAASSRSNALPQTVLSLGALLRNAAQRAAGNILLIGCYMVFFSVLTSMVAALLPQLPLLLHSWMLAIFEMSLGVNLLAGSGLPLSQITPWAAAIISFGGLSVQAQVLAMIAGTDISPRIYLLCRPLQAGLAFVIAWLLCQVLSLPAAALPAPLRTPVLSLLLASTILALASTAALLGLAWAGKKHSAR